MRRSVPDCACRPGSGSPAGAKPRSTDGLACHGQTILNWWSAGAGVADLPTSFVGMSTSLSGRGGEWSGSSDARWSARLGEQLAPLLLPRPVLGQVQREPSG
jgi:hypothetical protein